MASNLLKHINFALIAFAALFAVLATAGNHWRTLKTDHNNHLGLWKQCTAIGCSTHDIESVRPTQVLMVLSCICFVFIFAYMLLLHFVKTLSPKFTAILLLITFVFEVAAMGYFTHKMQDDLHSFEWSFALGWVSAGLALITGIISFFHAEDYDQL
ncbi:lens fiber membrane intrinsic protein-like [Hydractinia symbiolongicarpus]|uniref:lens fiber membrane intrinsic protein-like n=1 Tax=Hydractinia symbiolongicarpus TaxID=13093 RepID=UPI00254F573A|nr:lens fiber membrane intrinsic protein-like [Hydractinia symbiolongicarpus]